MKNNSIFTSTLNLEDEDVIQDTKLTADDLVSANDDIVEYNESEKDIEKDITSLEDHMLAYEKLEKQYTKNQEALENDEGNEISQIRDEDIVLSQEALFTTLSKLGYNHKELKVLSISSEARFNKYEGLYISNESIIESIKQIIKGIINLFISIGKKIKFYITKFINWLFNRKGSMQKMLVFCQQNKDLELPVLNPGHVNKISNFHSAYLAVNNGILNIEEIIEFYSKVDNDPFVVKFNYFIDIIYQPSDKIQESAEKLTKDIQKSAMSNKLHKNLIELASKSSDQNPIYILGVNGNKITSYSYSNTDKQDKYKLGFTLSSYKLNINANFKEIKGCKTFGDLGEIIRKIISVIDGSSSFGKQIERFNSSAIKEVEMFSKKLKENSITDSIQREITNHTLKIIKDIGSRSLVVLIGNYAKNTSNLTKTVSYYVKPVIKANKQAEKLAAKQNK